MKMTKEQYDQLIEFIKEGNDKLASQKDEIIKEYLNRICPWLSSLYGGSAPDWVILFSPKSVSVNTVNIVEERARVSNELKSKLKALMIILIDMKNEYQFRLQVQAQENQLTEIKNQTKRLKHTNFMSFCGLLIAILIPSILSRCTQTIKLDNEQLNEIVTTKTSKPVLNTIQHAQYKTHNQLKH